MLETWDHGTVVTHLLSGDLGKKRTWNKVQSLVNCKDLQIVQFYRMNLLSTIVYVHIVYSGIFCIECLCLIICCDRNSFSCVVIRDLCPDVITRHISDIALIHQLYPAPGLIMPKYRDQHFKWNSFQNVPEIISWHGMQSWIVNFLFVWLSVQWIMLPLSTK